MEFDCKWKEYQQYNFRGGSFENYSSENCKANKLINDSKNWHE